MKRWLTFFVFFVLIGAYLTQLPFSGSLPGKVDSWFYVATFEYLIEAAKAASQGYPFGNSLYPESSHLPFGNFSPLMGLIYAFFRLMGSDVIWSFWALTTVVLTSNAYGTSIVARALGVRWHWSCVAGLFVALNNFSLANLDNLDGLFWGPGLLAIALAIRVRHNKTIQLNTIALALGMQLMASSYMFLFSTLIVASIILPRIWGERSNLHQLLPGLTVAFSVLSLFLFPLVWIYFVKGGLTESYNPIISENTWMTTSLHLPDLFTYLPNSLLSTFLLTAEDNWYEKLHSAGIGFVLPVCGILGISKTKSKGYLACYLVFFLVLAIGSRVNVGGFVFPTPAYPLYEWVGLKHIIRLNIRAFLPAIACLSIGTAFFLSKRKVHGLWPILMTSLILFENVPFKLRSYRSAELLDHLNSACQVAAFQPKEVILHLPTSFYSDIIPEFRQLNISPKSSEEDIIHEYAYMLFQAKTGTSVVNGFTGFIPRSRIENQLRILRTKDSNNGINALVDSFHIDHVLLHKDWFNRDDQERNAQTYIDLLGKEKTTFQNDQFVLFSFSDKTSDSSLFNTSHPAGDK